MNVVIIDDERKARQALIQMLADYCPSVKVIAEAEGVEKGIDVINNTRPDLILLDIKMKDGSGFDLIKKLTDVKSKIIFVTAYNEYAIKAFKFSAIDYLLKPVDPDDLKASILRVQQIIEKEKGANQLEFLLSNFSDQQKRIKKITLKTATSIFILNISEILYCKSDGNYTEFHCSDGTKPLVSRPIGEYEDMLQELGFLRVHHSYLVNMDHATRFDKNDGGILFLNNGESIPVSSRKKEVLLEVLSKL